jgi:hypothetical protein
VPGSSTVESGREELLLKALAGATAAMAALHSANPAPALGGLTVVEELPEGMSASRPPLSGKFCKAVAFVHKFASAMV